MLALSVNGPYRNAKFDGKTDVDRSVNVTCEGTLTDVSPDYAFLSTLMNCRMMIAHV